GTSDEPPQTAEIQEPQTPVVDDSADDANVAASPVKIVDVDALRVSADEAIALGDYAGAIVLLNKIQKTRPDDRKLKQEVLQLGDLFREQQEVLDSWQSAVDAFNTGDYRSALTVFYRLPETERGERLSRYMINGWFNLGMQALTSGNCDGATAHFTEASDINSDDPGVSHGLRLADECSGAVRDRAWMDRIESIGFRDLEYGG
ncbi:MAG: hypothetical protein OEV00_07435, partial [Acidobacteriota bacterium]|nr:hypothetical protein [Acidobacteriota bacterium]